MTHKRRLQNSKPQISARKGAQKSNYQSLDEKAFSQDIAKRHFGWFERPRLHTAIFHEGIRDEAFAKMGLKLVGERAQKEVRERARRVSIISKEIGWSNRRLDLFKQSLVNYRKKPSIENYLKLRQQFPEVEIIVAEFGGIDPLFILEEEFRKHDIDPELIAGCLDADEPSIDALCLRLMELIVKRTKISKDEPGHIAKRRAAISDSMIDYLIVTILESFDWNERKVLVPASLVVLARHRLTGMKPDLHTIYRRKQWTQNLAILIAQHLKGNEKLSINRLASIAAIPRSRAARLLKDKEFTQWLETAKMWAAEGLFERART